MADRFSEIFAEAKKYANLMYGGEALISPDIADIFADIETGIEKRRGRLTEKAYESAARRGVLSSDITDKYIAENVTAPIEEALAGVGMQKAGIMATESRRRRSKAINMAVTEIMRKEKEKKDLLGSLGKLGGTLAGAGLGFAIGGPGGALAGGNIGSQLFGGFSDSDWDDILEMVKLMESGGGGESLPPGVI